jgi:hypothetical protein
MGRSFVTAADANVAAMQIVRSAGSAEMLIIDPRSVAA